MIKFTIAFLLLAAVACAPNKETVSIIKGDPGERGADGTSTACSISETENGLTYTCGDTSITLRNGYDGAAGVGEQGPRGDVGPAGPAGSGSEVTVTDYALATCTAIAGTIYYAKTNGTTRAFYTGSTCHSSTKTFELGEGDSYVVGTKKLAVYNSTGIKVLNF